MTLAAQAGDRVRDAANEAARSSWAGVQPLLDYRLLRIGGQDISVGALLAAVVVLGASWLVSVLVRRTLLRFGQRHEHADRATLYAVSRMAHYLLLTIGVLLALTMIGVPVGRIAVFASALGVGLGFGLQAIFSNFVSGLILLFDRSLKVGDFVELSAGVHGEVRDIKIRATTIVTNDNIDILVPNSEFVTGRVVNWTHREVSRRLRIGFGVAYGSDKELVKKAALEAAVAVPFTLEQQGPRKPQVWLTEFADSSLNFELVVWLTAEATRRPGAVKAAYLWELHTALEKYRIEIPFPQQDLHLRSVLGLTGEDALVRLQAIPGKRKGGHAEEAENPSPDETLSAGEREALGTNDAQVEAQSQITSDIREKALRKAQSEQGQEPASPPDQELP